MQKGRRHHPREEHNVRHDDFHHVEHQWVHWVASFRNFGAMSFDVPNAEIEEVGEQQRDEDGRRRPVDGGKPEAGFQQLEQIRESDALGNLESQQIERFEGVQRVAVHPQEVIGEADAFKEQEGGLQAND